MIQLQLYIEGQQVEMFKDESITLTQNITDVKKLDAVLTDYSRTFTVPASKSNNQIFKHFYNYYIEGFNAKIKKNARIHLNYKPFKTGKVRFEGVNLKNNKPESYRLTFFGDTIKLTDVLGEDKLAALTELGAFDFAYNDTNLELYMNNGMDAVLGTDQITDAIIVPLITHTSRLIYDSSANETNNVYPSVGTDLNGVPFSQLKPALRVHAIIKAIEMHYDIKFSEDFFSTTNFPYHQLYLWLHTKSGGLFEDQQKAKQFKSYDLDGNAQDELVIRSNYFSINNSKRHIDMKLDFTVDPGDDTVTYNLVIHKNGEEFRRFESLSGDTKNGVTLGDDVDSIEVDSGQYTVFLETSAASTFDLDVRVTRKNNGLFGGTKRCNLRSTVTTITDANFSVASNLPEMKVIDFLQGLFKMFNLVAYINDDDVIVVQTLDDYYAASEKLWDFTSFVDSTKSQVDTPVPFRQVNLEFEGTKTFLAANFNNMNNRAWGKAEYNEDSYFLDGDIKGKFEGETYEIKVPFEHMLFERLNDVDTGDLTKVQWGWHVDEKEQKSAEMPLLFYPIQPIGSSISARNLGGTKRTIAVPYMPSNSSSVFSDYVETGMSQSINFHAEIDEFARVSNEKTLFKTYYKSYIKDLFDERKRITKLTAEIPLSVTERLQLNDDIQIFDKIYRINSITTNFETNKSELELVNILNSTKLAAVKLLLQDDFVVENVLTAPIMSFAESFDISFTDIFVDSTTITSDNVGSDNAGFEIPALIDPVPEPILQNIPQPTSIEPCVVTAATLSFEKYVGDSDQIKFFFEIDKAGKVCDQENMDEYGFLIADAKSTLTASDDIDTLKADSNVTVVNVTKESVSLGAGGSLDLTANSRIKETTITGLTHPATKYARFYVKTNTDPDFDTADSITACYEGKTDQAPGTSTSSTSKLNHAVHAGLGSAGYDTIPTKAEIEANAYTVFHGAFCGEYAKADANYYHNGAGRYPEVGDLISRKAPGGVGNYGGGLLSFQSTYGDTDYFALAVGDILDNYNQNGRQYYKIIRYIVVEYATAEVVEVYECPAVLPVLGNAVRIQAYSRPLQAANYTDYYCGLDFSGHLTGNITVAGTPDYTFEHNGSGTNPEAGDQIKFTAIEGIATPQTGFNGNRSNFLYTVPNNPTRVEKSLLMYDYHALLILDDNMIVVGVMVIDISSGTALNVKYCT